MEATVTATWSAVVETGVTVIIERSPEGVFRALTDMASYTDWARGPEESLI
jgi:uncharacterized protein YndB with AHSA1/START domain